MKELVYLADIARQLKDDLHSAERIHARACEVKNIFEALALLEKARKRACLRAAKAALPYLRGLTSDQAMYARNALLFAARTGQSVFIPDWIRFADRRV